MRNGKYQFTSLDWLCGLDQSSYGVEWQGGEAEVGSGAMGREISKGVVLGWGVLLMLVLPILFSPNV
jgi:hypothetical protein